jgi:hypothetical protein
MNNGGVLDGGEGEERHPTRQGRRITRLLDALFARPSHALGRSLERLGDLLKKLLPITRTDNSDLNALLHEIMRRFGRR